MTELIVDRPSDGVVLATLNRPDKHNAISMSLQAALDELITRLEADEQTRCLVVTGAGDRAFSAGYDLHEMADWDEAQLAGHLLTRERWIGHFAATPVPIVVALDGITYGAGAILASAADVRVAGPGAVLRFTAAAYGGANATWTLPLLIGHGRAAELLLTARKIAAADAAAIGLVNAVADDPVAAALAVAAEIAANPPAGTRAVKRLLREHAGRSLADRFEAENALMRTDLAPRPIRETFAAGNGSFTP